MTVFNGMEAFKNDFRCITMDQRTANGGESTGPIPTGDPWGAFADDQLGLMDHLGIRKLFFMGYRIGGPFGLKLIERAPDRVVAPCCASRSGIGQRIRTLSYNSGRDVWGPERRARRPEITKESIEAYLHNLYRARGLRVQRVARIRPVLPHTAAREARRHAGAPYQTTVDIAAAIGSEARPSRRPAR